MHVLVWSNLDFVVCVHLVDSPPGEAGGKRAAGNGPAGAGAGAGLELSKADRQAELEKERPGIKKEIRTGATAHLAMHLGGGSASQAL